MDPFANSWESAAGFVAEFCALGGTSCRGTSPGAVRARRKTADRELGARLARGVDGTLLITTTPAPRTSCAPMHAERDGSHGGWC